MILGVIQYMRISEKTKQLIVDEYVNNKEAGQPEAGLGLTRKAPAGTAKSEADLGRTGSRKA